MTSALSGITVVDFTEYIAGPYCTMMLADMGANVIKVEPPGGDRWRYTAPVAPNESRGFLSLNRGKRSISLDLQHSGVRPVLRRLFEATDVVVVNYRPGVAKRLGIDYESVREINPGVVYAENTAFGNHGPYSHRGGYDLLSQAASGMMLYEHKMDDGVPTTIAATAVADLTSGMFLAFGIASALVCRMTTGVGQKVETNLFASAIAAQYRPLFRVHDLDDDARDGFLMALSAMRQDKRSYADQAMLRDQFIPKRAQNNYYRVYESSDGLVAVSCLNNRQRRLLATIVGINDSALNEDQYDWANPSMKASHAAKAGVMENVFRGRTTAGWLAILDAEGIPCGPVLFPEEIADDPHVKVNNLLVTMQHPIAGTLEVPACPITMSESRVGAYAASPILGADGKAILLELGFEGPDVDVLISEGMVSVPR